MDRILCQWLYDLGHQLLGVEHMKTAALDNRKVTNSEHTSLQCKL
jgi:hypothetical protein